jgi:hypothetical protein
VVEFGDHDTPPPARPRPQDSSEKVLEYFRAYWASSCGLPQDDVRIQTLDLNFAGTGLDLYFATQAELTQYVGSSSVAAAIYSDLRASHYGRVSILRNLLNSLIN